ncbi:MAG TPA: hypothetical protein PLJ84_11440 [Bacteroidales bacterium]|nr:hypothetical protein [Bacteroidales bacterium]HPT03202.1 hypothetical protein [Bacteroidales bacterium]
MKRYFILLAILFAGSSSFAGTGNANDGILFAMAVILIMMLILGIGYFTRMLNRMIRAVRTWNWIHKHTAGSPDKKQADDFHFDMTINYIGQV